MRKLTIQRQKTFTASFMKITFYIQDEQSDVIVGKVNGMKCRKLGDLRNGEEASFEVSDDELILFAVYDNALDNKTVTDTITISSGHDDIVVRGKNKLNPFRGNPYIFDK